MPAGRRELQGRLAGLSLPRQVLVLAFWPLLEQFMAFLVGTVDLVLAGHLSPAELQVPATDALGTASYVMWLMAMIHSSFGVGATAMVARAVGGRHRGLANAALGQSMLLAGAMGVLVGVLVFVAAPLVGLFAGLEGEAQRGCIDYLRIVSCAAPASGLLLVGAAALRGAGDMRTPFAVMVVVNVTNVVASVVFVYAPAPLGGHGVVGIAAGTTLAWVVGLGLLVLALIRGWGGLRLHRHRLIPHRHTLLRIARIGGPAMLERVVGLWLANFLILMIVGHIGQAGTIGAHMIAIRVESLSFLSGFALSMAAATLTGQYLGLGDTERARKAALICFWYAALIMGVLGVFFFLTPGFFAGLITDSPAIREQAVGPIRICGPVQVFFALQMVFGGALRGAGDTRVTMWITSLSTFLARLPAAAVMGLVVGSGLSGVWLALCGELVLRGVLFGWRFFEGSWARIRI